MTVSRALFTFPSRNDVGPTRRISVFRLRTSCFRRLRPVPVLRGVCQMGMFLIFSGEGDNGHALVVVDLFSEFHFTLRGRSSLGIVSL